MKRDLWIAVGVVVIVILIIIGVLFSTVWKPEQEEVIKIGYIAVLSGPAASAWGFYGRDATQMAVEEINNMHDVKLEIIWGDSAAKPEQGLTEFKRLNDAYNLDIFIVDASGVASAIVPLADAYKKPIVLGAVALVGITKQSEYVFRNFYICEDTAPSLARRIYEKGIKKVGILSANEPYAQSCSEYFKKKFSELGGEITTEEKFTLSEFDFRTRLMKIEETDPEAIYIIGYEKWLLEIVKQMKELGIDRTILTEMVIYAPVIRNQILNLTNPPTVYFTTTDFYLENEKAKRFSEMFENKYGKKPPYLAGFIYDTIYIIAEAAKIASRDNISLKEALKKVEIDGVSGHLKFDENRETHSKAKFVRLNKDGELVLE